MENIESDFCFCTLALGQRYRFMTKELAGDLRMYFPGIKLVVFTDKTFDFEESNVIAFKHSQQGIQHCYNDKRFVLQKALSLFCSAIYIDADTRILQSLSCSINMSPGITGRYENLVDHVLKNRPKNFADIKKVASKLEINLESASWIGDSIFAITRDNGKEKAFFDTWGVIARYLELRGMHSGQGNVMGLAAAKVGWKTTQPEIWQSLVKTTKHLDASYNRNPSTTEKLKKRIAYHYRLNKQRFNALRDFDFYYR